jgi:triosephosphate isomerase
MASPRVPMVAGNWKMNTTVAEGVELAAAIAARPRPEGVDVAVLPPFVHLWAVSKVLAGTGVALGAQDCFWEAGGPYTGEVAPSMLAGWCDLVLVGHSERRALGETDEQVARKLRAALNAGLRVIVAVGELLEERRARRHFEVVDRQVVAALEGLDETALERVVVAYEPVWAIGTGESATPRDAQTMGAAIRANVGRLVSGRAAEGLRILYGGSVGAGTAEALFAGSDVDGGLIGGASLVPDAFAAIIAGAAASLRVHEPETT